MSEEKQFSNYYKLGNISMIWKIKLISIYKAISFCLSSSFSGENFSKFSPAVNNCKYNMRIKIKEHTRTSIFCLCHLFTKFIKILLLYKTSLCLDDDKKHNI